MRRVYDANLGDYVLCCKYADHRNEDQWQVGFIKRTWGCPTVFEMENKQRLYFKVCFFITPDEGDEIIKNGGPSLIEENGEPEYAYKYAYKGIIMTKPEIKPEWVEKYNDSFASHLRYYRQAADKLGVDKSLVLIHDGSKSMDEEFPWYVRRFGGEIKDDPEWLAAWNHHIHNNPHHWEYWIIPGGNNEPSTILPMPERYVLEMVADWMGSGRAYTGDWDMTDWLSRNLSKIKIHNKTRDNVEKILVDKLGYGKQDILLWRWSLK